MAETELITEESHELLAGLKSQMQVQHVIPSVLEWLASAPAAPTAPSRRLRVIQDNLVGFNDVIKRATATIDLKIAN